MTEPAETHMATEWRRHLDAGTTRRAHMTHDPDVPGLHWPAHLGPEDQEPEGTR